jgi:hypothetical protein
VKPKHAGASELYERDKAGMLLHDMLFAPFFAGAAGSGHVWFWKQAIDQPNHWRHFERFNRALEGIDPSAEGFEPAAINHSAMRIYVLRGKRTTLAWCRDSHNDWQTELRDGVPPQRLSEVQLNLADLDPQLNLKNAVVEIYDPWHDRWTKARPAATILALPAFERSLVLRVRRS